MTNVEPPAHHPLIEPLESRHDRAAFSCGIAALDRYAREQMGQDVTRRVAAAFVLIEPPDASVLGFYTLAAASVRLEEIPRALAKRLPKYPFVPATLLGRLAVDTRLHGRGYGTLLLLDALTRSVRATRAVGSAAVIVDAKDDGAKQFYERFGFTALLDARRRLFLPMATIAQLEPPRQRNSP